MIASSCIWLTPLELVACEIGQYGHTLGTLRIGGRVSSLSDQCSDWIVRFGDSNHCVCVVYSQSPYRRSPCLAMAVVASTSLSIVDSSVYAFSSNRRRVSYHGLLAPYLWAKIARRAWRCQETDCHNDSYVGSDAGDSNGDESRDAEPWEWSSSVSHGFCCFFRYCYRAYRSRPGNHHVHGRHGIGCVSDRGCASCRPGSAACIEREAAGYPETL